MKVILSKPGKNKSLSSGGDRKSDKANLSGSEEFDDKNSISQQSQGNLDLKSWSVDKKSKNLWHEVDYTKIIILNLSYSIHIVFTSKN